MKSRATRGGRIRKTARRPTQRRFSSLCFGTVKVAQSTDVASGDAVLSARETARAARQAIDAALARLRGGDVLVLFGEGTRSRTAQMQLMLAGTARYLDAPGTWVLPAGLTGPEALFPVVGSELRPTRLVLQLGQPLRVTDLAGLANHDRRVMMDAIGLAVASLVPSDYRGEYGKVDAHADAKAVLAAALQEGREDRETHVGS